MANDFKTQFRKEKEAADMAFYLDYMEMTAPNRESGKKIVDLDPVFEVLMSRHKVHARSTCYAIIKRVEARLKEAEQ